MLEVFPRRALSHLTFLRATNLGAAGPKVLRLVQSQSQDMAKRKVQAQVSLTLLGTPSGLLACPLEKAHGAWGAATQHGKPGVLRTYALPVCTCCGLPCPSHSGSSQGLSSSFGQGHCEQPSASL